MEAAPLAAGAGCYADSIDSMSPRSRGGDLWDEPLPPSSSAAAAAGSKLRLMCSFGGHIVPRPHDKTLCYLGGETRIVVVDRQAALADLHARLSRSLLGGRAFSLKYQLPAEDLDSLISVATDDDLDNMIDEYDRIAAASAAGKTPRLRLFLFPAGNSSSSSVSSLLEDSKSEAWFVDALNGAVLRRNLSSADSAASSVNCLLGLDDSNPSPGGAAGASCPHNDLNALSALLQPPPPPAQRQSADDLFSLRYPQQYPTPPLPQLINPSPLSAPSSISPGDPPVAGRDLSSDDDKPDGGGARRSPAPPQPKPSLLDAPVSGDSSSRAGYYQERPPSAADPKQEFIVADGGFRQPVHVTDQSFLMQAPPPAQSPPQQQFVQAHPHLPPLSSYYQIAVHPQQQLPHGGARPYSPQVPMYFLPVQPEPAMPMPAAVLPSRPKSDGAAGSAFAGAGAAQPTQLFHMPDQLRQFVGYHPPSGAAGGGYRFEFSDHVPPQNMYYAMAEPPPQG